MVLNHLKKPKRGLVRNDYGGWMSKKKKRGGGSSRSRVKGKPKLIRDITRQGQWASEVLESEKPVVVDFWAPWCAPCRIMGPIMEEAAKAYKDLVTFAKVNTESAPEIARSLNIRSIPTLVVFYHGGVLDVSVGVTHPDRLNKMIRRALDKHEGVGFLDKLKRLWSKPGAEEPDKSDQVE
jgi:thioredoxin 1